MVMKIKLNYIFLILILCCQHISSAEDKTLIFVQILYRHGDRAPIELYPNDANPASFWELGLGKLTILGRKQHYALGKYFRSMYKDFITTSPLEINVTSSDVDRCLRSAETNLASFYAPSAKWTFDDDFPWQPIPINYIPIDQDKYLESDSICPRANKEQLEVRNSEAAQAFIKEHMDMFESLSRDSGSNITYWKPAGYLYDVLSIERRYNLTIPQWAYPWWDELKNVSALSFFWNFNSPLLLKLRAGPLLKLIIERMNWKLSGDLPQQKIQIYSAHDTNVALILNALKLYNMKSPPYCSSIIFELYEINDSYAVRMLFLNSTNTAEKIDPPHVLVLKGCQEYCPLDYFINHTKDLIPEDWEKECQLKKTFMEKITDQSEFFAYVSLVILFTILAMVFLGLIIFALRKACNRDSEKYSYHLMPMS